ncbi:MAG: glycosyltransferase family 4 protein [bacterium]
MLSLSRKQAVDDQAKPVVPLGQNHQQFTPSTAMATPPKQVSLQARTTPAKPLRLAVVTETWYPDINGVAHSLQRILCGLLDLGVKVDLYYVEHDHAEVDSRITYFPQKGFHLPFYHEVQIGFPSTRHLQKQWQQHRPDIVQIVTEGLLGYSAMRAANQLAIPVVSDYRTNFQQYSRSYHLGLFEPLVFTYLRHLHNKTQVTLVPTAQLSKELSKLGFNNVQVMARGIDTQAFNPCHRSAALRTRWGIADEGLVVLYVGRLAPEKNLTLAVKAFRAIQMLEVKTQFVLVGDGPIRKTLAQENPDFIFCGVQRGQALHTHYASGDIFLSPSTTETFGNTILEAMASALAVVSYDYAAAHEHIISGENGLTATLGDEQGFIQQAQQLAQERELRQRLRENACLSLQENSWQAVSQSLLDILYQHIEQPYHD